MTIKFSEMCAVRTDLASRIEAALTGYQQQISQGYGAYLAPAVAEGETELDVGHQLVLLARRVKDHRQHVESLDEEVLELIHGDEQVRVELDQRVAAVDAKLRLVRSAYRGFYGRENLGRVGLAGEFPRGAVRLHRHAVTVKTSLESPELVLEPLLDLGLEPSEAETMSLAARLAPQLEPELSQLGELLDERHRKGIVTLDGRLKRQEVIRRFDDNIRGVVRLVQGMFRLAGRNDLGVRMRPILSRVLRKLDDPEAKEQPEGAEAAEAAEAEPPEAPEVEGTETEDTAPENTESSAPSTEA